MNYKHLFPTFRNRYLFIRRNLEKLAGEGLFDRALNLGAGEGDYDQMIAAYCRSLTAVDINETDVEYARTLNAGTPNLNYQVDNALDLSFPDNTFDLIISVEVIEHVGDPERMIGEIQRVLKPRGFLLITFPYLDFPFTYDPINRVLSWFSDKHISQGAYAFGHDYLIGRQDFLHWASASGLSVVSEHNLSGYLVGLLEMYWTGVVQSIFKANASNQPNAKERKLTLRPSQKEPALARMTDGILAFDHALFGRMKHSVGRGFILQKTTGIPTG